MTGLVFAALTLFDVDLLIVLLLVLIFLPVLSALQLLIAKSSLQIGQFLDPAVAERGDPMHLVIRLSQNGWLSHGEISLVVQKPGPGNHPVYSSGSIALTGGRTAEVAFNLDTAHRGVHAAGLWRARSRDLLGLFYLAVMKKDRCRGELLSMTVLPKPSGIPGLEAITALLAGLDESRSPKAGDEVNDLANLRARRPGESLKRVHWKISARLDQMMVKEFENPVRRAGLIVLDMARPAAIIAKPAELIDLADYFTDRAAFLVRRLLELQIGTKAVCYQKEGRLETKASGSEDFLQLQLMLAGMDWTDSWPAEWVLAEETGNAGSYWFVLLLSTRLNEASARMLTRLQAFGLTAFLVLILEEPEASGETGDALRLLDNNHIVSVCVYRTTGENHVRR